MNNIVNTQEYIETYNKSINHPEEFWAEIAEDFQWHKKWDKVLEWDFRKPEIKWFQGGKLNITENCLDRHLEKSGDKIAFYWEPNNPFEENRTLTYRELHEEVCKFANVLKKNNIQKGDKVCIYMPMVPELAIAMLACARIGAVHSIVFAGFSSEALATRINDASCKMLITADGTYRGTKKIELKEICDAALEKCDSVEKMIVYNRTSEETNMQEGRDLWWHEEMKTSSSECEAASMDAEDMLFILYTSGSTGKPKGMVHTTAGYMIYTNYTFKNVFQYQPQDIYWCTADIGWITGHSYIVYGPLSNGASSVMFEGIPSFPDYGRFWQIVEKYNVNHFYTAPTAIRSLAKQPVSFINNHDTSSLKVLGTVGEPINEEAWHWYDENVGKGKCPIVDTWWQTETGGMMISSLAGVTPQKPTYATLPLPGVQPVLLDDEGKEIHTNPAEGKLAIKFPWPSIARTIYGNHERYKKVYFSAYDNYYFTGDGAYRDENGNYRITGRVDDVIIVSGHNLGTAPIENAINEHKFVVESAIVGFPHEIKGTAMYAFVTLYDKGNKSEELKKEINQMIAEKIGAIAKCDKIQFVRSLPKTRSGKIMRRILRKIACNEMSNLGDVSTLLNPDVVEEIIEHRL
ncbi:acetate--CoA ligase [Aureivirga sp. CE67]|uniref:acetate--CoA ligase n=1 Tax=Aureivirga sp. CE67 TaxID=1788983 RepID=UPI0018C921C9|nr:acetate--CoA ligase [Aureivirga sp. CE67]